MSFYPFRRLGAKGFLAASKAHPPVRLEFRDSTVNAVGRSKTKQKDTRGRSLGKARPIRATGTFPVCGLGFTASFVSGEGETSVRFDRWTRQPTSG